MQVKTFCCWVDMGDIDFDTQFAEFQAMVAYNLKENGILPTINIMKDSEYCRGSIQEIRTKMYKHFPLRRSPCPYGGMRCCGSCIRSCGNRCVMDSYNKCCQVLLHGMTSEGVLDISKLRMDNMYVKIIYDTLCNPETSYYTLTATAAAIITKETNPKVAQVLGMFDEKNVRRENHPFSYDYSPEEQTWVNPKTGKIRRTTDSNGYIQFIDYPRSGLCAYCMPKNTIDRSRLTKYERNSLGNSFLK